MEFFYVKHLAWDYGIEFHQDGQNIEVAFQPRLMSEIMASVQMVHDEPDHIPSVKGGANQQPHPTFGPCPNTEVDDFNFGKEVEHLPFKLNLGDILWMMNTWPNLLIGFIVTWKYFLCMMEDMDYCDWLTHMILTNTNKTVYLPNVTFLRQLQGDVYECLNTWLCQGIFHPSNSPHASQVVTVHKNLGRFISLLITGN